MSAPVIVVRGLAVVAGVSGTVTVATVLAYPVQQKARLTQTWEEEIVKDVNGFDAAWIARNEKAEASLGLKFTADTAAHAAAPFASGGVSVIGQPILLPFQTVTLGSFTLAALNQTWQNISGTDLDLENTKVADGDYKLRVYGNTTQQTAAITAPS